MNDKTFSGKVALVTGGTSGIGKATAIEFARAGAKVVALEFAKQNIRINAVAPGPIATDMWDRLAGDGVGEQVIEIVPVQRLGAAEEIAAAVLYLASDDAKFTIGTSLVVDGGLVAG